jgi:hypothetical protein
MCVSAFLKALGEYGTYLESVGKHLDVKGTGWIAPFPAPNVTVKIRAQASSENPDTEQLDEAFEALADDEPGNFDFLGKNIDSGFRVSKNSGTDRFAVSVELAWLLCEASHNRVGQFQFAYHGRDILKGVISDRPYPVITIDTERSASRREVRIREAAITRSNVAEAIHLKDFLTSFMMDEGIEQPLITIDENKVPVSYEQFRTAWLADANETERRREGEKASETAEDGSSNTMPSEIEEALNKLLDEHFRNIQLDPLPEINIVSNPSKPVND